MPGQHTLRLSPEERDTLERAAAALSLTKAEFVRQALRGDVPTARELLKAPPLPDTVRTTKLVVRIHPREIDQWRAQAHASGIDLSSFIRQGVFGAGRLPTLRKESSGGVRHFVVRLPEGLSQALADTAKEAGVSQAEVCRRILTNMPVVAKPTPRAALEREAIGELRRIGNNLNQLVRLFHTPDEAGPDVGELTHVLLEVQAEVRLLQRELEQR